MAYRTFGEREENYINQLKAQNVKLRAELMNAVVSVESMLEEHKLLEEDLNNARQEIRDIRKLIPISKRIKLWVKKGRKKEK